MSARDELRKYVHLLADAWTPRETTDGRVEWLYALVRAEVRREDAARLLDERRQHAHRTNFCDGITHAAILLNRWADEEAAEKATSGDRQPHEGESTPAFFQSGHTYEHSAWTFRCDVVTTDPENGEPVALGWFRFRKGTWHTFAAGAGHWTDGWTDVTESGEE